MCVAAVFKYFRSLSSLPKRKGGLSWSYMQFLVSLARPWFLIPLTDNPNLANPSIGPCSCSQSNARYTNVPSLSQAMMSDPFISHPYAVTYTDQQLTRLSHSELPTYPPPFPHLSSFLLFIATSNTTSTFRPLPSGIVVLHSTITILQQETN